MSERLGRIPRRVSFIGGQVFETPDAETLDAWLALQGRVSAASWIDRLERRWLVAAIALVVVVSGSFAFVRWGVPVVRADAEVN